MPSTDRRWSRLLSRVVARPGRSLVAVVIASVVAACGSSLDLTSPEPATGPGAVYTMASANDLTIPATFTADGKTVEVRKGALTLGTDSTYIFSVVLRSSVNGTQPVDGTVTFRGPYHRTGTAIALVQQSVDTLFAGTYGTNQVSLLRGKATIVGDRYIFTR